MFKRTDGRWCEKILKEGKNIYIYAQTKRDLIKKLTDFKYIENRGKLFDEVINEWWKDHEKELEYNTARGYESSIRRAKEIFGEKPIKQITSKNIENEMEILKKQGFSKKTVQSFKSIIRMTMQFAGREGYIDNNPCDFVKIPKGLPEKIRTPPEDDEIKIVFESKGKGIFLLPYFLACTGCRPEEAYALQGKDFDYENKTIRIDKAVYFDSGGTAHIKPTKTINGIRTIPMIDKLSNCLPILKNNQFLFSKDNGKSPLTKAQKDTWIKKLKEKGISATPYQFRHAFATYIFEANLNDKDAQALMGHSDPSYYKKRYAHVLNSRKIVEKENLNSLFNLKFQ